MSRHRPIRCVQLQTPKMDVHPMVTHVDHGFCFVVRGHLRMDHGASIVAKPGMVILVPAGVPHRVVDGADVELLLVGFCASCLRLDESAPLMSGFRRVRRGGLPLVVIPKERRPHLGIVLKELLEESQRDTLESMDVMRSLLVLALAEVRRAPSLTPVVTKGTDAARHGSVVADALEFIQRHCFEPISLADVAHAVHRTPAYVTTLLSRATGYSAGQWITEARLREACVRLAHTDDPIDAVAGHVGWKDKTHFIRQFRKAIGSTPAAWRKAHRGSHVHD